MPQPKKGTRLGGDPAHQKAILANLTTELFRHGRVQTTHAKAKTVQPLAEKMITFGKRGDVHARRQVLKVVRDRDVVHKLFADIGPANAQRDGGYTRVLRLGPRKGDSAQMALLELVEVLSGSAETDLTEEPRRRWSLRRRKGGTRSATAQAREEERAARAPVAPVEEPEDVEETETADDGIEAGTDAGSLGTVREDASPETDVVEADPAEVEARLAAQEDAARAAELAEDARRLAEDAEEVAEDAADLAGDEGDAEVTDAPADSSLPDDDADDERTS